MSASQQTPAPPPMKKGIVKQVSRKICIRKFFGYSLPTQQMDSNMFFSSIWKSSRGDLLNTSVAKF